MTDEQKKAQILGQIQTQITRIEGDERELESQGYELRKSYTNKVKMPAMNASISQMQAKLADLKKVTKTSLKEHAKSFTYTHLELNEKNGEIVKGYTRTIRKRVAERGSYITRKQTILKKKAIEIRNLSLFDLADSKIGEYYEANVVASGNDRTLYIPGGHYGYIDANSMPAVIEVIDDWKKFKAKYYGKPMSQEVRQVLNDVIATIENTGSTFGSAQQFVIYETAQILARTLTGKGLSPKANYAGDQISPIGTPYEPHDYDQQAYMDSE